jgi:hypothetical protein
MKRLCGPNKKLNTDETPMTPIQRIKDLFLIGGIRVSSVLSLFV